MIIKVLIGFALLILFSFGPQLAPTKQDTMDEKAAEYKLAVFAAEMQKIWPKIPTNIKAQFSFQASDPDALRILNYMLEDFGTNLNVDLDPTYYSGKKGFYISEIKDRSYTNPFTNETKNNIESIKISQTTNKGTKIMYIEFPEHDSDQIETEDY